MVGKVLEKQKKFFLRVNLRACRTKKMGTWQI